MTQQTKGKASALFPLLIFILLFIGTGVLTKDFSNMPLNVAVIIAAAVAIFMNRKVKLAKKN